MRKAKAATAKPVSYEVKFMQLLKFASPAAERASSPSAREDGKDKSPRGDKAAAASAGIWDANGL